jgi:hypothetical protein
MAPNPHAKSRHSARRDLGLSRSLLTASTHRDEDRVGMMQVRSGPSAKSGRTRGTRGKHDFNPHRPARDADVGQWISKRRCPGRWGPGRPYGNALSKCCPSARNLGWSGRTGNGYDPETSRLRRGLLRVAAEAPQPSARCFTGSPAVCLRRAIAPSWRPALGGQKSGSRQRQPFTLNLKAYSLVFSVGPVKNLGAEAPSGGTCSRGV